MPFADPLPSEPPAEPREPRRLPFTRLNFTVILIVVIVALTLSIPLLLETSEHARRLRGVHQLHQLSAATQTYRAQHIGDLPRPGNHTTPPTWADLRAPENVDTWYNQIPPLVQAPSASELSRDPARFYSTRNLLFVPSADYDPAEKLARPLFAIAMNTEASAAAPDPSSSSHGSAAHRNILFFDAGLPGEKKRDPLQATYKGLPSTTVRAYQERRTDHTIAVILLDGSVQFLTHSELPVR